MGEGDKEGLWFCGWGEDIGELGALLFLGARAIAFLFPEGHRKRWWKGMFLGRCGPSREIWVDVHPDLKARGPFQVSSSCSSSFVVSVFLGAENTLGSQLDNSPPPPQEIYTFFCRGWWKHFCPPFPLSLSSAVLQKSKSVSSYTDPYIYTQVMALSLGRLVFFPFGFKSITVLLGFFPWDMSMGSMTTLVTVVIWPHVRTVCLLCFEREDAWMIDFGHGGWVG